MSETLLISVIITLVVILSGITGLLIFLERKISRLEKNFKKMEENLSIGSR